MKTLTIIAIMSIAASMMSCGGPEKDETSNQDKFKYLTEQFGDSKILRYQVPGFDSLSLKQKKLIYFLSQAALCGRDITYDQNCKYNLLVRKTCEAVYVGFKGDRSSADFINFRLYLKELWFNNGLHHHYSTDKTQPEFSKDFFVSALEASGTGNLPLAKGQTIEQFTEEISKIIFDPSVASKRVSLDPSKDLVLASACNFYEGVNQKEAEEYYTKLKEADGKAKKDTRISYGLNSRLVKENGKIKELPWMVGGLYSPAIEKIVYWLNLALPLTETPGQKASVEKLIEYYKTGSLVAWDEYNVLWVKDLDALVDFVNGFIESYGDPMAMKATWESVVNFKNLEATKRTMIISGNALYFETNSPTDPQYKKKEVKGVTAKVITVAQLGGECDPTTPIGINLPNANWIRSEYGSKSVTMDNITYAYDQASLGNGFLEEFAALPDEVAKIKEYGYAASSLTTDMHECLGHASGQLKPGVTHDMLKNYHSSIEESRADLFALYYILDTKMEELGLLKSMKAGEAEYDAFMRNGLMTQLVRIKPGKDIEESHMRDRSLIAHWVYEKGKDKKIVEKFSRDGKTYFRVNDYKGLRTLFGQLLNEIQRITSEGDYKAARELIETYAVKVDHDLHKEVLERYKKLDIAPYTGFINPAYELVMKSDTIENVIVSYPDDFATQMMEYSKKYSFLQAR
ncbi:MAG: dihydrofolate reductase [Bacteroidetes bacterium]|nr:dihydrofolate reductase [Bacteroidota bacterium]